MLKLIAQKLVDRLNQEISSRVYGVTIDFTNSCLLIQQGKLEKLELWLYVVGLDGSLIELEEKYPIQVQIPLVVQPELFVSHDSGDVIAFWNSFLPMLETAEAKVEIDSPVDWIEILENRSGDFDEISTGEEFWEKFWLWVRVKIGSFATTSEKSSADGVAIHQLIPRDAVLAIWDECTLSIPEA